MAYWKEIETKYPYKVDAYFTMSDGLSWINDDGLAWIRESFGHKTEEERRYVIHSYTPHADRTVLVRMMFKHENDALVCQLARGTP